MKINYKLYSFSIMPYSATTYQSTEDSDRPVVIIGLTKEGEKHYKELLKSYFHTFFVKHESQDFIDRYASLEHAMFELQSSLEKKVGVFWQAKEFEAVIKERNKREKEAREKALRLIGIYWRMR